MGTNEASTPEDPGTVRETVFLPELEEMAPETRQALQEVIVAMRTGGI